MTDSPSPVRARSISPEDFGEASVYAERMFKRELFLRLYSRERVDLTDASFYWGIVQRAWAAKPEDC